MDYEVIKYGIIIEGFIIQSYSLGYEDLYIALGMEQTGLT